MKNSYIVIMIVVAFIFGAIFGFYAGILNLSTSSDGGPKPAEGQKNTFASGWEAARQKLIKSGGFREHVSRLSGTVKEVKDGKMVFETNLVTPLDSEELKTRTAVLDDSTELTLRKLKPQDQYRKDREEYQGKINDLRAEIDDLQERSMECEELMMDTGEESLECQALRKNINEKYDQMQEYESNMNRYIDVEDPKLSEIKPGYRVRVISMSKEKSGEEDYDPAMMEDSYENIGWKKEFKISSAEVREVNEMEP